jgi:predicted AAA+ superfamily ATPase
VVRPDLDLYPRRATALAAEALADTRVVVINGARQTGKSTLARLLTGSAPGVEAYFLDDATARDAARSDPMGFVRHDGLLLIDEVQRVPELMLAIKYEVDRDPRPGRFLLTGSARLLGLRDLPDSLPGRSETIELWPLSQGEIDDAPDGFVDAAFRSGADLRIEPVELRRSDYLDRALRGGYPEAVRRTATRRRSRFFESYLSDLIARDLQQVADIERPNDLRRLLATLAASTAGLAVPHRLSSDVGLPATTLRRYLDALELVYVIRRIPAWSSNLTTRAVATAKLMFVDTGIAGHLAGMTVARGAHPLANVGPILENFAIGELARQLTWAGESAQLYHYRDRDGYEVDAVLEHESGNVVGIEVKAAETVRTDDFRGLRRLHRRLGNRFVAGFVLYAGTQQLSFGDRLAALPLAALWQAAPG